MQDRIFSGNDISSGVGTKTVSFTNPFFDNQLMQLVLQWKMQIREIHLQFQITVNSFRCFYLKTQVAQIFQELLILLLKVFARSINKYGTGIRFYNFKCEFS